MQWNVEPRNIDGVWAQAFVRDGLARLVRWVLVCGCVRLDDRLGVLRDVDRLGGAARRFYFARRLVWLQASLELNPWGSMARGRGEWHWTDAHFFVSPWVLLTGARRLQVHCLYEVPPECLPRYYPTFPANVRLRPIVADIRPTGVAEIPAHPGDIDNAATGQNRN